MILWGVFAGSHLAVGLYRGPEADQVGSGVRERQVSSGAADEGVQDSALVHVLQVAQVLTQVLLRGVALGRDTAFTHSGGDEGKGRVGEGVLPAPSRTR